MWADLPWSQHILWATTMLPIDDMPSLSLGDQAIAPFLATSDRQQLEWIIHDGFTQTNKAVGFLEAKDVSRLLNILGMCKFHAANIWRLTSDNARCTRLFNIWTMPCTAREVQTPVQDTSTFDMATRGCDKSTVGIKRQGLFCHTAQYQALAGQCERTYHEVSTSSEPQQCCQ